MKRARTAGFALCEAANEVDPPGVLEFERVQTGYVDLLSLALDEGAHSCASRYPGPTTVAKLRGLPEERRPTPLRVATPGPIVPVVDEVLGWPDD